MTKAELIAKQQLELEELKQQFQHNVDLLKKIQMKCICIGGPLNDNKLGYNQAQMRDWHKVLVLAESVEQLHNCRCR